MLWLKAFPHQLPRSELFAYSFLESLRNWTIYLRERDFCLIYRNNFDHRENGRTRWMCNCQTWGSASQVDLFKALSFPHAHKPWNLSVLNLSVMFVLYWKPEDFQPCQGTQNQAVLCKVLTAGCIKVDRVVQEKFTWWINSGAPSRVVMLSYASQSKFFQDLT